MATSSARMSYSNYYHQQQNGKFNTLPPHGSSKDTDISHDMHHKMSKKIAQLTKVIYALNTKKDEHEAQVQHLREQHEQELERLAGSTKRKLLVCDQRLSEAEGRVERIAELEQAVLNHQTQQQEMLLQHTEYKHSMEGTLHQQEIDFSQKIWGFSGELLEAKKTFQEQLQTFEITMKKLKIEHEVKIEQLHKHYQEEISNLVQAKMAGDSERAASAQQVQHSQQELDKWKIRVLEAEDKLKLTNTEWESKLDEARAFFDKEMAVTRQKQEAEKANALEMFKVEKEKLQEELDKAEKQLVIEVERLEYEVSEVKEQASKYQAQLALLVSELEHREGDSSEQISQLSQLQGLLAEANSRIEKLEKDLAEQQLTLLEKTQDLLHQKTVIKDLETGKVLQEAEIQELNEKVRVLNKHIDELKMTKGRLESNQNEHQEKNSQLFKNLQEALNKALSEKSSLEAIHAEEMKKLKSLLEEKEKKWSEELEKLKTTHKDEMDELRFNAEHRMQVQKQDLEKEVQYLRQGNRVIADEYEKVGQELKTKLTEAEKEIQRFEQLVQNSEKNLNSASTHIFALKEASSQLKGELDQCRVDLRSAKNTNTQLQSELEKAGVEHQTKLAEYEKGFQENMKKVCEEAEKKSKENIRLECERVKQEVSIAKDEQIELALRQSEFDRKEDMRVAREKWEAQKHEMQIQLSYLQTELDEVTKVWTAKLEAEKAQIQEEADQLELTNQVTIAKLEDDIRLLEESHEEALAELNEEHENNIQELKDNQLAEHNEAIEALRIAHQGAIKKLENQRTKDLKSQLERLRQEHEKELEMLKEQLHQKHCQELCQQVDIQVKEVASIKGDLDRLAEVSQKKERDHIKETETLKDEIERQLRCMTNLKCEIEKMQQTIDQLLADLDGKKKEFADAKIQHQQELEQLKGSLLADANKEKENIQEDHIQEMQQLVAEFNRAQQLLKNKISVLNLELLQCEEKYKNRESRTEDLEEILRLRNSITDRELQVKKFQDEKRFFQMELINRETNFNKIFGSTPQVGVINPLNKCKKESFETDSDEWQTPFMLKRNVKSTPARSNQKTKTGGEKILRKFTSAPSLQQTIHTRLEHLPGSPVHDEELNPVKPLPPMMPAVAKKYIH